MKVALHAGCVPISIRRVSPSTRAAVSGDAGTRSTPSAAQKNGTGGRSLRATDGFAARKLLPPVPFFWAALGVLRVPASPDTAARVDGDTLRIEIGTRPAWRATFMGRELLRLDLIDDGRIPQTVMRVPGAPVRFCDFRAHRTLDITVRGTDTVPPFDAAIWH